MELVRYIKWDPQLSFELEQFYFTSSEKGLQIIPKDGRRAQFALDRLWNLDRLICYGQTYEQEAIRRFMIDRMKPAHILSALKCVHDYPGGGYSFLLGAAIFFFIRYEEDLSIALKDGVLKKNFYSLVVCAYLSNVVLVYRGRRITSDIEVKVTLKKKQEYYIENYLYNSPVRKKETTGNYFTVPNAVFHMDLKGGEIAVYAYLLRCEDRNTFVCYPSYETIGKATGMSVNTVMNYVHKLEERGLIDTEHTTIKNRYGQIHNNVLKFHIRPIVEAVEKYDEKQMQKLQEQSAKANAQKALEEYDKKHPRIKPEKQPEKVKKASEQPQKSAEIEEELPF